MAVTEAALLASITSKFMTALETVNTTTFTVTGSPAFEAATAFPNGRSEKFLDLNGSTQYATFDASSTSVYSLDSGIISMWIKPDYIQTNAGDKYLCDLYSAVTTDGIQIAFFASLDDWQGDLLIDGAQKGTIATVGETWSVDAVLHIVYMWHATAGLDNSKSCSIYVNNVLKTTGTTTWSTTGDSQNTTARIGCNRPANTFHDGGIFDWSYHTYTTLAASYTDAEIVQALYSNTFNGGTAHKFTFELAAVPTAPSNCTVSNVTTTSCKISWTDNSSDETGFKVYVNGSLNTTTAANATSYIVTGLTPNTSYNFYVTATSGAGDSAASNTVYTNTAMRTIKITEEGVISIPIGDRIELEI